MTNHTEASFQLEDSIEEKTENLFKKDINY